MNALCISLRMWRYKKYHTLCHAWCMWKRRNIYSLFFADFALIYLSCAGLCYWPGSYGVFSLSHCPWGPWGFIPVVTRLPGKVLHPFWSSHFETRHLQLHDLRIDHGGNPIWLRMSASHAHMGFLGSIVLLPQCCWSFSWLVATLVNGDHFCSWHPQCSCQSIIAE